MNWQHAWTHLNELVPPELTHYYQQSHPGINWWLKCAVPVNSDPPLLDYWHLVAQAHADLVHVCDTAWDWHGNRIADCVSVWMQNSHDVIMHVEATKWHYELVTFQEGQSHMINHIQQEISNNPECATWHDINSALHLLTNHVSDNQAHVRRKSFRVIHGKKTTSHKRARSNLDRE